MKFLFDNLNATKDVEKVKTIGAQKLTQNIGSYLMRCVVMTIVLFEVGDAYEKNEIRLNKEINQLKNAQKIHIEKIEELEKQLLMDKKQKETSEPNYRDLENIVANLKKEMESARESN